MKHRFRSNVLSSAFVHPEFPEIPMSTRLVRQIKTGDWRDSRPLYKQKTAPCNYHCPAGEDVRGYISLFREGKYESALGLIRESNPLPSVCGRVCFHPCEQNCNRRELDEAISIHAIERFLADQEATTSPEIPETHLNGKKIAVIGSGPSGLSCAYHLSKWGYLVTIFERLPVIGGMLRIGIPEYRLPKKALDRDIRYIMDHGVEIRTNVHIGKDISVKELQETHDAIFFGIGAQLDAQLGVFGHEAKEICLGLHFLKQLNSKTPISIGTKVAVIGGGNTAIDCARSAQRMGSAVQIIYRRSRNEMPAMESEILEAEQEGIEFMYLASPVKAHLKNGKLFQLECIRMKLGEPDESGRKRPIPLEGSNFFIEVDSLITAIGENVDFPSLRAEITIIDGAICTNDDGLTTLSNVYAGGDAINQPRTVVHAIGSGMKAAYAMDQALQNKRKTEGDHGSNEVVTFGEINPDYFQTQNRERESFLPTKERFLNFDEINKGFSEEIALRESNRCFSCGRCTECNTCLIFCPDMALSRDGNEYRIDYDYCKGCGVCAEECPRGLLSMEVEKRGNV